MKKLLLVGLSFILLIVGCAREYECDVMMQDFDSGEISSISEGESSYYNVYGVTWPKGEKEAEEQCVETFGGQVSTDETGQQRSTFHSCRCEKK